MNRTLKVLGVVIAAAVITGGAVLYWFLKAPKVSIVMPVYNGEKYLEQTMGFLLLSDFKDFEFIVIDDGSTDKSLEKLKEIAAQDRRVKVYQNEKNMGIVKTRNRGLELARGEYIALMDQDDWSLPERLGVSVKYLDEHPETTLVAVQTILMKKYLQGVAEERVSAISFLFKDAKAEKEAFSGDEIDENLKISLFCSLGVPTQSASMVRRDFINEHNIRYKEGIKYADDYFFFVDLIKAGARFHHIEETLHVYNDVRSHSDEFYELQVKEADAARKELSEWAGIEFRSSATLDVRGFMCKLFLDLKAAGENGVKRFSDELLDKNYKLICEDVSDEMLKRDEENMAQEIEDVLVERAEKAKQ